MTEGWDRGGRFGKRQETEWAQALPEMLQLVSLPRWRLNLSPGSALALLLILTGEVRETAWSSYTVLGEIWRDVFVPVCFIWNAAAIRNCCTPASLVPPGLIPDGAGFGLLLAARARLCSAPAPFLFPSSLYIEHMLLFLPQTLPSVEILSFVTMWGKQSLKIGFSSEDKVWLFPNILVTATIHSCSLGSALLLDTGVSLKPRQKRRA